jgi:hypothetical protein
MVDVDENRRGKSPPRTAVSAPQMSDSIESCRKKTLECERRALLVSDQVLRKTYMELAHQWREMAAQAEALDRLKP